MIRFSDDGESHGITAEFLQSHPALLVREEMAEASGGRTHRRRGDPAPAGFEDRDDHRTACASVLIFNDVAYQTFSVSHTHPPMRLRVEKAVALRNSDNYSRRGTVVESALNAL